jgi:hypothetical protein
MRNIDISNERISPKPMEEIEPIDEDISNTLFSLDETIDNEMKSKIFKILVKINIMKTKLRISFDISASVKEALINPVIKLERKIVAYIFVELIREVLLTGKCLTD